MYINMKKMARLTFEVDGSEYFCFEE